MHKPSARRGLSLKPIWNGSALPATEHAGASKAECYQCHAAGFRHCAARIAGVADGRVGGAEDRHEIDGVAQQRVDRPDIGEEQVHFQLIGRAVVIAPSVEDLLAEIPDIRVVYR